MREEAGIAENAGNAGNRKASVKLYAYRLAAVPKRL